MRGALHQFAWKHALFAVWEVPHPPRLRRATFPQGKVFGTINYNLKFPR